MITIYIIYHQFFFLNQAILWDILIALGGPLVVTGAFYVSTAVTVVEKPV